MKDECHLKPMDATSKPLQREAGSRRAEDSVEGRRWHSEAHFDAAAGRSGARVLLPQLNAGEGAACAGSVKSRTPLEAGTKLLSLGGRPLA
jgi:hypothetical protein